MILALIVSAVFGILVGLVGLVVHRALQARTPKALQEPETDDNGYFINPAMAAAIDALEEACQIGEYAPGKSKYKCQHEWINGVCFWCEKSETPHRPRKFARKPTNPVETLEAILEGSSSSPSFDSL